MEIIEYSKLLPILKDLKGRNKRIGNFTTTGRLHQGHLEGIRRAREVSDIVLVFFAYYYNTIFFQLSGREVTNDYSIYREDDLKILESTGMVDYVTFRYYDPSIYEELVPLRKIVESEYVELCKQRKVPIPPKKAKDFYLANIAMPLRMNPDEHFCDTVWVGDKNNWFRVSEIIAKKYGIPIHYNYYPISRSEDGLVLESSTLSCSDSELSFRKDSKNIVEEVTFKVYNGDEIPKIDGVSSYLFNESMDAVDKLETGKNFYLYCQRVQPGRKPYTDFIRITG